MHVIGCVDALLEACVAGKGKSNCSDGNNSVWLHKWLVRDVMQSTSTHRSPLDWLVAHLTASTSSFFLGAVIDDLVDNAMTCNAKNMRSLSVYVRRIGVLEYAALRSDVITYTLSM